MTGRDIAAALLVGLLVAGPAPAADAQSYTTYVVRPGDTCSSIAERWFGNSGEYPRIHALNPDLGPMPHQLEPGTRLRMPRVEAPEPDGELTAVVRDVRARAPASGAWRSAEQGQDLYRGWQVATEAHSTAEITFRDRSVIEMREHTLVIVLGGSGRVARTGARRARLDRGVLRGRLEELAGAMTVTTPGGDAEVEAGQAVVAVTGEGASAVSNLSGRRAIVSGRGQRVLVPPGTGSVLTRGRAPSAPRPLPAAPRWRNDLAGRFIGLTGHGATLRGSWQSVDEAARYRVEVARRPDGRDVVAAVETRAETRSFAVHGIPPGAYYVSVATIDRDGLEGPPSPRRAMLVLEARIIDPDGGDPIVRSFDPGDPSVAPSPPPVMPGTWIVAPAGFRCATAGGEPHEMVTLGVATPRVSRANGADVRAVSCVDSRDREVPAFELEVVTATVETRRAVIRPHHDEAIQFTMSSELPIPSRLIAWAVAVEPNRMHGSVDVGRVERTADGYRVSVRVSSADVTSVTLAIGVQAGDTRAAIAHMAFRVHDPSTDRRSRQAEIAPPRVRAGVPSYLHQRVTRGLPVHAPSSDGIQPWVLMAVEEADQRVGVRLAGGVVARVFDEPLRLELGWWGRLDTSKATRSRAGDLRVGGSWVLPRWGAIEIAPTISVWLPTSNDPSVIEFAPSAIAGVDIGESVEFLTRQGAVVGAGDAAQWASGYAVVWWPQPRWSVGAEVALSLDFVSENTVLGAVSTAWYLEPLELSLSGHVGSDTSASDSTFSWSISIGAKLIVGRRTTH